MLTPKQLKLLEFIQVQYSQTKKIPTFLLMKNYMDVSSNQAIEDLLVQLENKGYISRLPGKKRTILLTKKSNLFFRTNNFTLPVIFSEKKLLPVGAFYTTSTTIDASFTNQNSSINYEVNTFILKRRDSNGT